MKERKFILVVAGNWPQFKDWCKQQNITVTDQDVRYISEFHKMYGYDKYNAHLVFTGTWYAHSDIDIIRWNIGINFPHLKDYPDVPGDDEAVKVMLAERV